MRHLTIDANGGTFHVATCGSGPPLLLLHGWPEFWLTWEPVMTRLSTRFEVFAPDLRGFGQSSKPDGPWGAAEHAGDMLALLPALGLDRVGVAGHDVGGAVMQAMARAEPERLAGLFFFGFVYPGIGRRMGTPDRLDEIWYLSFHQKPLAPALVGSSRAACRHYIGHFLRHWAHRKEAFDDVLEAFVDNFMAEGNLAGGFAYYRAAHPGRIAMLEGRAEPLPPIAVPACVRWPSNDTLFPFSWTDRLGETFAQLDLAPMAGVGHFPHREDPDAAGAAIDGFFQTIGHGAAGAALVKGVGAGP